MYNISLNSNNYAIYNQHLPKMLIIKFVLPERIEMSKKHKRNMWQIAELYKQETDDL